MPLYRATKNLTFTSLKKGVIVDETIELEKEYADKVNADLKLAFPDVKAVLVPSDEATDEVADKKPATRKKKSDTEAVEGEENK